MAVHFYRSNTMQGGAQAVLTALKEQPGVSNIVIVPDAFTLSREMSILSSAGREGSFNVEVMSFSRLAAKVLGDRINKCLSPQGAVMLLEKVIIKNADSLLTYSKAAGKEGFAAEMFAGIAGIRNSGISVANLQEAQKGLSGYIKDKTSDIITLYNGYLQELAMHYTDSTTRLEALYDYVKQSDLLAGATVYILDFYTFTAKQYMIIGELMKYCADIHIAVIDYYGGENRRIYPNSTFVRLKSYAEQSGAAVVIKDAYARQNSVHTVISDNLFGYREVAVGSKCDNFVALHMAENMADEVTYIATEISRLVRGEGLRYKDIALLCGDLDSYLPYIERIFPIYEVPYFADKRYPLSGEAAIKELLAALSCRAKNMQRTEVMKYVKCRLFEGTTAEKNAFQDYCERYGVDYSRFCAAFTLGEQDKDRETAEAVRQRVVAELNYVMRLPSSSTVSGYIKDVLLYWQNAQVDIKLQGYAEKQRAEGYTAEAERTRQSTAKLQEVLRAMQELLGDEKITLEEFLAMLRSGAESTEIALVPMCIDNVYVGGAEQGMYETVPVLFVIGAADGKFPYDSRDEGIITDRECAAWQRMNVVLYPTNKEANGQSRFHTMQLLLRAEKKLYVGYSRGNSGEQAAASSVISELKQMFNKEIIDVWQSLHITEAGGRYSPEVLMPTAAAAKNYLLRYIREHREQCGTAAEWQMAGVIAATLNIGTARKGLIEKILKEGDAHSAPISNARELFFREGETSVSQLENYFSCPFSHFITYGLRAKERDNADVESRDTGDIIHSLLQKYYERVKDFSISEAEIYGIVDEIMEQILQKSKYAAMREGTGKETMRKLSEECRMIAKSLTELSRISSFTPSAFEVKFGAGGAYKGITLCDGAVNVKGKIDRIDLLGDSAAVIDYKTGTVKDELKYVYYGTKLQLYIYLRALQSAGLKPVAAFYLPIKADYGKDERRYAFRGQMIDDNAVIEKLDGQISASGVGKSLPLSVKKDKYSGDTTNFLLSKQELGQIIDYSVRAAEGAAREIMQGFIEPTPLEANNCEYCNSKNICGKGIRDITVRVLSSKNHDSFAEGENGMD